MTALLVSFTTFASTGIAAIVLIIVTYVLFLKGRFGACSVTFAGSGVTGVIAAVSLLATIWFSIVTAVS